MASHLRLLLVSAVLLAAPADAARLRFQLLEDAVADLHTGLAEVREAVCLHYRLSGDLDRLPRFCPRPPQPCELPIEVGPCEAAIPRWGFDTDTGVCVGFLYGGCQGNANNFETAAACRRACGAPEVCKQPIDPGPCDGAFSRYGFDAEARACVPFVYGGCAGNDNRFETLEACEATCPSEPVPVCEQPAEVGPCLAVIPRWYHDPATGACERFMWGGCGGNDNNFETRAACERACVELDVCSLPADPGPCDAAFSRWYHDSATGSCERFVWGGCGGNGNNFETLAACEQSCPRCDAKLCRENQECRLWRDPGCGVDRSCAPISYCADVCERTRCPAGTRCELTPVVCVRAPCPPLAECVPDDPCASVRCAQGTHCEVLETPCYEPPCDPVAACVND